MKKATINDVAALAEVSMKTVSRVLNNEPHVSAAKKEKVLAAAAKLNYQPSQSARSLAGKRSYLVALVYDSPLANYITRVQNGALRACRDHGYDLLIHPAETSKKGIIDEVIDLVVKKRVDGLLLTPPLSDNLELITALSKKKINFVRNSPGEAKLNSKQVSSNEFDAAYKMTEYLASLGHRRIGFIAGAKHHSSSKERLSGYKKAVKDLKLEKFKQLVQTGDYSYQSGLSCAERLLDLNTPPTAIFASNDEMAHAVFTIANKRSIRIPKELSVAGFDDMPLAEHMWPQLTTIRQPISLQAELATKLVIDPKNQDAAAIVLDCELIIRESTATH